MSKRNKCGCEMWQHLDGWEILYCPLHHYSGELLSALKAVLHYNMDGPSVEQAKRTIQFAETKLSGWDKFHKEIYQESD